MLSLSSAIVVDVVVVGDKHVPRNRHDWTMGLSAVDRFRKKKKNAQ